MNIVGKIVRGDEIRKTRFHDEQGNYVGAAGLSNFPKSIWTNLAFRLTGNGPLVPWISYNALERIEQALHGDANVLEFGSGLSTIWFARRCAFLHSIEHNEDWHRKVTKLLEREGLTNVRYDLKGEEEYTDIGDFEAPFFDFCLVDGARRLHCVERAIPLIKPGGILYLDNSDVGEAERRQAVALMTEAARKAGNAVEYFTDFAPTQLHANQGLLIRL